MVNLLPDEVDGDHPEFALPNPIRRYDPRWVGVREIAALKQVEFLTPKALELVERILKFPSFGSPKQRSQTLAQKATEFLKKLGEGGGP